MRGDWIDKIPYMYFEVHCCVFGPSGVSRVLFAPIGTVILRHSVARAPLPLRLYLFSVFTTPEPVCIIPNCFGSAGSPVQLCVCISTKPLDNGQAAETSGITQR